MVHPLTMSFFTDWKPFVSSIEIHGWHLSEYLSVEDSSSSSQTRAQKGYKQADLLVLIEFMVVERIADD